MSIEHNTSIAMLRCLEVDIQAYMGLSAANIRHEILPRAIQLRCVQLGISTDSHQPLSHEKITTYLMQYESTETEKQCLAELLVVPETWFFRYPKSFDFLQQHAPTWIQQHGTPLPILSLPCSTGEEPYSIAMSLLDAGIHQHQFRIDAADISTQALKKAEQGVYTQHSFRSPNTSFQQRHFSPQGQDYRIHNHVRSSIHFSPFNVMQQNTQATGLERNKYSIIFCRNLLIYFDAPTQQQVLKKLHHMLYHDGLLFIGHGDAGPIHQYGDGFKHLHSQAFVYQKHQQQSPASLTPKSRPNLVEQVQQSATLEKRAQPHTTSTYPIEKKLPTLQDIQQQANAGQGVAALKHCLTYLKTHATNADAWVLLAMLYASDNQQDAALQSLKKAFYLNPNHQEALTHLALWADDLGQTQQAQRYRKRLQAMLKTP